MTWITDTPTPKALYPGSPSQTATAKAGPRLTHL